MDLHLVFAGGWLTGWCTRVDCRADLCAGVALRWVYKGGLDGLWNGTTLAFWLRSSVVSVLSSLTTRTSPLDSSLVNLFLFSLARRPLLARLRDGWPCRCTIGLC